MKGGSRANLLDQLSEVAMVFTHE